MIKSLKTINKLVFSCILKLIILYSFFIGSDNNGLFKNLTDTKILKWMNKFSKNVLLKFWQGCFKC